MTIRYVKGFGRPDAMLEVEAERDAWKKCAEKLLMLVKEVEQEGSSDSWLSAADKIIAEYFRLVEGG